VRRLVLVGLLLCAAVPAGAAEGKPVDPPRWRLRLGVTQGVAGSRLADQAVAVFPTTVELGVRIWGPLSITAALGGVLVGGTYASCGDLTRPNAVLGTAGLRVDFANGKSASWAAPFVELHAGVAGQPGGPDLNGICQRGGAVGTGGLKLGLDAWLGRVAVTVAFVFDYLPVAPPIGAALGATILLK
jgi:hypothetical protein